MRCPLQWHDRPVALQTGADLRHRTMVIGDAAAFNRDDTSAQQFRAVTYGSRCAYEIVERTTNGPTSRHIKAPGPTDFITAMARTVEPEWRARVCEGAEQARSSYTHLFAGHH